MTLQQYVSFGFLFFILIFVFFIWPNNQWHFLRINEISFMHKAMIIVSVLLTISVAILPMSLSPYWNGSYKIVADMQQYDRLGDALIQGHSYIDNNDIDPKLEALDNPYDVEARKQSGAKSERFLQSKNA